MLTFPQLKKAINNTMAAYGITEDQAKIRLFGLDDNTLLAVAGGDLSSIQGTPEKTSEGNAGTITEDTPNKITEGTANDTQNAHKRTKKKRIVKDTAAIVNAPTRANNDIIETVQGEIVDNNSLPPSMTDTIEEWLADYAQRYNIELDKCSNLQWRAACIYVGQKLKASGILLDKELQKKIGGTPYSPYKMECLLYIWEWLTSTYKHIPLLSDYISFTGASREWFYNTTGKSTSGQLDIAKKAREIEESALSSALTDHKENPTGRIYYTKARLGWQETTTIQHISATASAPAVSLPVFDNSISSLPDNSTKS